MVILVLFVVLFLILIGSFANSQIINGKKLRERARDQQLLKRRIGAKRGNILDRNGEILAQSIEVDTITLNPKLLKKKKSKEIDKETLSKNIAEIFGIDSKEVLEKINSEKDVVTIVNKVEKEKVTRFEELLKSQEIVAGFNIDKDIKRNYPYSNVASNIIGFVREDNIGQEGVEKQLDDILTGREGRIITQSDVHRNLTKESPEQLIKAENGKNVYLTIDIKMQSIVEKHLKEAVKQTKSNDGMAIIMNPKNGEVLAMANEPTYDLNNPRIVLGFDQQAWDKLSQEEKLDRLFGMWKNKPVTDVYDPGSTFKIITSAMGIEEGVTVPNKPGDFFCSGIQKVYDREIKCWRYYRPHGSLTLTAALENSCNPAFMQLAERLGVAKFYKYLRAFGLTEKTGIDLLGETNSVMHQEKKVGPVELATASFGQRFQVSPIQLINAIGSLANGGVLLKPQTIHKIENPETKVQQYIEKKEIRQVVSVETSKKILEMMRSTVKDGTGRNAAVPGYNVGGKSGTSEPVYGVKDSVYVASFVAVVPTENPEYIILMLLRDPKVKDNQGGQIVAPVVGQILKEVLANSKLTNKATISEIKSQEDLIVVKSIEEKEYKDAKKILSESGLELVVEGNVLDDKIILSQTPKPGTKLERGSKVYAIVAGSEAKKLKVPDLKGKNITYAKRVLKDAGLNFEIEGEKGIVMSQTPLPDTEVMQGTVIKIIIKEQLREAH